MTLLGWSEERLGFTLKEDDFLFVKPGQFKPAAEPISYKELTEEEARRTAEIKAETLRMRREFEEDAFEPPFAFLQELRPNPRCSSTLAGNVRPFLICRSCH